MMDEDDERNTLRQVLKERCPDESFRDDDIKKLVDAGYTTARRLARATKADLVGVLPGQPGLVGLLLEAFVQPAGMFPSQGFPVMMLIFGAIIMGG